MRKAKIYMHGDHAGDLFEIEKNKMYRFSYRQDYDGPPISLTIPKTGNTYEFEVFPPFFEGLLPEGFQLEALLRKRKIDRDDLFSQLVIVGEDMVGAVTVLEEK